jgi:enoyl-CoA hydratase/carnithine racemase
VSLAEYTVEGAVARITLNRPPVNALNGELIGDIDAAITRAEDDAVRAVVIHGGKHFAAGADIKRFVDAFEGDGAAEPQASGLAAVVRHLEHLDKPVIAAITGYALGGGLELAMGADFRFMADDAKVGQPEILLGIIPGAGGTQRLQRLIGFQKAKELNMSGRHVPADEALALGIVDRVHPAADVVSAAMEHAGVFATGPTKAYAAVKRAMGDGYGRPIDEAMEAERDAFNACFATEDAKTGILAFIAKEQPTFVGR